MIKSTLARLISWKSLQRSYSTVSTTPKLLIGSAPNYSKHLIIQGPSYLTWPSHFESVSPLFVALGKLASEQAESKSGSGLNRLGFTFADFGGSLTGKDRGWNKLTSKFETPEVKEEEVYSAILYPDFIPITISLSTLEVFKTQYLSLPPIPPVPSTTTIPPVRNIDIFICTHTLRDCRCGDIGEPLTKAIQREVAKRRLGKEFNVRVSRIAHIGGHIFAGNVLVYKEGGTCEWYGLLKETDASKLVESALSDSPEPLYEHWRGRLGLTSMEVQAIYDSRAISTIDGKKKKKEKKLVALGEKVELRFKSYEGEEFNVVGYEGESIMDVATRNDLPSILATCGGHAECATCHCLIKGVPDGILPLISEEEEEQLDFALGRTDDSRLSCQLPITKELGKWIKEEGGVVELPRY